MAPHEEHRLTDAPRDDQAPVARRFCGVCGATWLEGWTQCMACAPAASGGPVPAGAPHLTHEVEGRRLKSAIVLYFALLAVSVVGIISGVVGASVMSIEFGTTLGMTAIIVLWCLLAARPALLALFRPVRPGWFLGAAAAALLTFGLAHVIMEGLSRWLGVPRDNYEDAFRAGGYGMGMVVLMVCVQPAVFEELAFRGIVFGALQPALSPTEAVFVSAGMFMILHLSPAAFPHTFAIGVATGFMRARTGSLLPGVLLHFVHNLLCVVTDHVPTG